MNFLIITNVEHYISENKIFGYAPYVREINLWIKNVDQVTIVAPIAKGFPSAIDSQYFHQNIDFQAVSTFNFLDTLAAFKSLFLCPKILFKILKAMNRADHIHLRCPGNMGFLGCLAQIFFPFKTKTAKYAGNWDFRAPKPRTYKWQQWLLSNTYVTKNMTVLAYGKWEGNSKNIKPFFTATYHESEIAEIADRNYKTNIKLMFVGMLVAGKNPLYAIKIAEKLYKNGFDISLELYGDGVLKHSLTSYISEQSLDKIVFLRGNQSKDHLKNAYQNSHFMILPSDSEGWPKAVAEAMFWGCIPLSTGVSCVPQMLGEGSRGLLLAMDLETDFWAIKNLLQNQSKLNLMQTEGKKWSQIFTTEKFESEIKKLL